MPKMAVFFFFLSCLIQYPAVWTDDDTGLPSDDMCGVTEKYENGWVDWTGRYYYGIGVVSVEDNMGSKARTIKAARAVAKGNILTVAANIRVDSGNTLSDYSLKFKRIEIAAIVRGESEGVEKEEQDGKTVYRAVFRAPISGVNGLTTKLLPYYLPKKPEQINRREERQNETGEPTADAEGFWIIDARGLKNPLNPSLFPRVTDEKGRVVYSAQTPGKKALETRGTALFATSDVPAEKLSQATFENVYFAASRTDAVFLNWDGRPVQLADLPKKPKKKRRKKKVPFIITRATKSAGLKKADVVISKKAAQKIAASKKSLSIMKEARVIILVDKSVGGVEGRLRLVKPDGLNAFLMISPEL